MTTTGTHDVTQHPLVQHASATIQAHLADIATLFRPGMKLTLIARAPSHPDGTRDMVVTTDDIPAVIATLTRMAP